MLLKNQNKVRESPKVLLFHGMTGSPIELQPLGHNLGESGYEVSIPTLSGHNSKINLFKTTRTASWVKDAYHNLEQSSEHSRFKVHLVGHSFGATLALYLALFRPKLVASLTLISPTLVIKPLWANYLLTFLSFLPEKLLDFMPLIPKRKNSMYCLVVPRTAYPVYSLGAAARMNRIIRRVTPRLSDLSVKTLILRDPNDHISHEKTLSLFKRKCKSDVLEVIEMEDAHHEFLAGKHRAQAFEIIGKFIQKNTAQQ